MNKKTFERIFRIALYAVLVLPILNAPPFFSPPHWGKTLVFRLIVSVILSLGVWRLLSETRGFSDLKSKIAGFFIEQRHNLPLLALSSFIFTFFLATLFSPDISFSLWGNPLRSGGFINILFLVLFAILAFFQLRKHEWKRVWDISLLTGVLVSVVALLQWQGVFEGVLVSLERRPTSTLGSPITLALYLLLLAAVALPMMLGEKKLLKKAAYAACIALFLFVILITETRAVYLGLFLGAAYFTLFFPQRGKLVLFTKGLVILSILSALTSIYFVNRPNGLPDFLSENRVVNVVSTRLNLHTFANEP
ncbi:MAG: hypothetical protein Q8Q38_00820, partial [bacterium]|nr:hypothetical protein [bacterium]